MIVKLTAEFIANQLVCPAGKRRIEFVDEGRTGLYIEVKSSTPGRGVFYYRFKNANNKSCHRRISSTDEIDLREARERVKVLKAEILLGKGTWANEKAKKVVITLDQAVKEYVFPNLHRLRSAKKYEQMYDMRISQRLGSTPINSVTRAQILSFHTALVKDEGLAPATANRHLAMLRRCFSLLVELDLLESNPASRVQLYPESGVEHYLETAELKRLLKVLQTDKNRTVWLRLPCKFSDLLFYFMYAI